MLSVLRFKLMYESFVLVLGVYAKAASACIMSSLLTLALLLNTRKLPLNFVQSTRNCPLQVCVGVQAFLLICVSVMIVSE